jgi:hypothetical protein
VKNPYNALTIDFTALQCRLNRRMARNREELLKQECPGWDEIMRRLKDHTANPPPPRLHSKISQQEIKEFLNLTTKDVLTTKEFQEARRLSKHMLMRTGSLHYGRTG